VQKIALIAASLAVLAGPVLAEDVKTTGKAPAEAKFSTVSKDEMFSSKLKGLNVYNQKDEPVGEITDIAIKNNQIDAPDPVGRWFPGNGWALCRGIAVVRSTFATTARTTNCWHR
jgi:hypothetical protein